MTAVTQTTAYNSSHADNSIQQQSRRQQHTTAVTQSTTVTQTTAYNSSHADKDNSSHADNSSDADKGDPSLQGPLITLTREAGVGLGQTTKYYRK